MAENKGQKVPMVLQEKGQKTKAVILMTARSLFYQQGYEETTMRQIAHQSGCNLGLLSYYFEGKSQLGATIYHTIGKEIHTLIERYYPKRDVFTLLMSIAVEMTMELESEGYRNFYRGLAKTEPYASHYRKIIENRLRPFWDENKMSEHEFLLCCVSIAAMKYELMEAIYTGQYDIPVGLMLHHLLRAYLPYLDAPAEIVDYVFEELQNYFIGMVNNFTPIMTKITW